MIVANKSAFFSSLFARYVERRIRGSFEEVRAFGVERLQAALERGPVLIVTNHTAWWDPMLAIFLSVRVLRADAYAMMDVQNLERLPFFRKLGAFGVDLADPTDGARAIRYAAKLLDRPRRLVWIFPQGREVPITVRPLVFRGGSAEVARVARGATTVAGAIRYEMGTTAKPVLWLSIGEELARTRDLEAGRAAQENAVARELERIDDAITGGSHAGFEPLVTQKRDWMFDLAQATLARFLRPRLPR